MTETRYRRSKALYARACERIPGGVNSPVRAFQGVGGTPIFIERASGCRIEDADGHAYIDYVGSWGPMILGHAHPKVVEAVTVAASRGLSYGAPTELEVEMADLICQLVPSVEVVRLVNSGTEATMSAVRLARGFTGRGKILKFRGCYHGHEDSMLVEAGSGVATLGIPGTPGVLPALAKETVTAPFNDFEALDSVFDDVGDELACAILEPVAGNMGCVPPVPGFLQKLRELTDKHGVVLIFDEVMTGFRVALGGAQALYDVRPDLTTLGKVIGGGMPVGAYGGRADIMRHVAPDGPVYQAGTLSGNPLAVTAGLTTLRLLAEDEGLYARLGVQTAELAAGLMSAASEAGIATSEHHVGAMFSLFFRPTAPTNYAEVKEGDAELFGRFFHGMLERGVYLAPSAFEAGFVSAAHGDADIATTLDAAGEVFAELG